MRLSPDKSFGVLQQGATKQREVVDQSRNHRILRGLHPLPRLLLFWIYFGKPAVREHRAHGGSNGQSITLRTNNSFPLSDLRKAQLETTFCLCLDRASEIRSELRESVDMTNDRNGSLAVFTHTVGCVLLW